MQADEVGLFSLLPRPGYWQLVADRSPNAHEVGTRPDIAYDADGNIYVAYVSPGVGDLGGYNTDGDMVIATASKATGYTDWADVFTDTRDFISEPRIDQQRLVSGGVLSIFAQENDDAVTTLTGTPLHCALIRQVVNLVVWAGTNTGNWTTGTGTDWDGDNNNVGEAAFAAGERVIFDDGAADFTVNVPATVAAGSMRFNNTAGHAYSFSGRVALPGAANCAWLAAE